MLRKEIHKLFQERQNIVDWIAEKIAEYDLKEYDFESGFERELLFEEYPPKLTEFLLDAYCELNKIDRKIAALKREYSQPIGASANWTDDDWEELHNR